MQSKRGMVWIVDDDSSVRAYLSDFVATRGFEYLGLDSGEQVLRRLIDSPPPALLLLDMRMPTMSGLEVLTELNKFGFRIPCVVLSGVGQIPMVVQALRLGASDYLVKPVDEKDLDVAIEQVLSPDVDAIGLAASSPAAFFQSSNPRMREIREICDTVAQTDVPILIMGESGVGKEVVASYLHTRSQSRGSFVKVNCAALPTDLLESELFGYERGAFTGAHREKPGKFEMAHDGTIMLDEVGEMSPLLQAKLLHILQDGAYSRLGGTKILKSAARIVTATNKRLPELIARGLFREDLYFRINVISLEVPPLRERREDIIPLCNRFLEQYRAKYNSQVRYLPDELLSAFQRYRWPGNVRQLENQIRRFLILPDLHKVLSELEEKPTVSLPKPASHASLKELAASAAEQTEKELIFQTLNEVNWNRRQAAQRLNICYKSLLNKLHRWENGTDNHLPTKSL